VNFAQPENVWQDGIVLGLLNLYQFVAAIVQNSVDCVPPTTAADLGSIDAALARQFDAVIKGNSELHWKIVQRGFWANGVGNLSDYLKELERFTMKGRAGMIRCPTLLAAAENDPLAIGAETLFAEGAGDHCEMMNRSVINRAALDWLDETLGACS
jgi:hypothetical protein